MTLRDVLFKSGGRKFLHASYVVTFVLIVYAALRYKDLLGADHWEPTVGAVWKITAAYLATNAVAAGATVGAAVLAKRKTGGKP